MPSQLSPPIAPLLAAGSIWLFLDYDGTLAEFEPTPDILNPNPEVVALLKRLVSNPNFRVAITSGRRLSHTHALLPVPGLILAGTYGVELRTPEGESQYPDGYDGLRPALDQVKTGWEYLITGRSGFYLEDKGFAIALHARFAEAIEADLVIASARSLAENTINHNHLKILWGTRFLEVAPTDADKGKTVRYLWRRYPLPGAVPVYIGDDDKDESGFWVVNELGGMTIVVTEVERPTLARYRLNTPESVRGWLETLAEQMPSRT
jgi:trehalose 6-phosphate phosphatase